jgi:hypothetical protein
MFLRDNLETCPAGYSHFKCDTTGEEFSVCPVIPESERHLFDNFMAPEVVADDPLYNLPACE